MPKTVEQVDRETRRLWPVLATPGVAWLILLFVVPAYAVLAVAFSTQVNFLSGQPIPVWNPLDWDFTVFRSVLEQSLTGTLQNSWIRTFVYCVRGPGACVLIGYPVAYYVARLAGPTQGSAPGPAARSLVDQLHHPDAGLDQHAPGRRLRQRRHRTLRFRHGGVAVGQPLHRHHRAGLRVSAVLHHPAVRLAGPHRPAAHRGVPRSGRRCRPYVPARHAAAVQARSRDGTRADGSPDGR